MAIGANSYGDTGETGSLVPRFSNPAGIFDDNTNPDLEMVETWHDQVSTILNNILATEGFSIPVSDADVKPMLDLFVNQEVAAMVEGVNGSGRFGPTAAKNRQSRFAIILTDVQEFVESLSVGMETLGAERSTSNAENIAYRTTDESGDTVQPIFHRESFGEDYSTPDV